MPVDELLLQALNGLSFGALLFLLASGFTLVFGLMKIVNLAHGAFYLVGGYIGIATFTAARSFLVAVLAGVATAAVFGLASERLLLRRVRGKELPEVLLTVGIALVIADGCLAVFGGNPRSIPIPTVLSESVRLGGFTYPTYRLFVIALATAVGVLLYVVQHRTRLGALIRAGVDDRETAESMGSTSRVCSPPCSCSAPRSRDWPVWSPPGCSPSAREPTPTSCSSRWWWSSSVVWAASRGRQSGAH
jgi:branched-chain amino acid transport system permease protein